MEYFYFRLLYLQWKKDFDMAYDLIRKAISIDEKCDFAYETLATLQVQRFVFAFPFALNYFGLIYAYVIRKFQ